MAVSAKERKLSRLGSCRGAAEAGGLGSPAARGHRTAAAGRPRLLAFLCAGVVALGAVHAIGGEGLL
jgi:hypothetical protein